jgi:hypothetical protein
MSDFDYHNNVPCELNECPYCDAGIPRRVLVEVIDLVSGKAMFRSVSEDLFERMKEYSDD